MPASTKTDRQKGKAYASGFTTAHPWLQSHQTSDVEPFATGVHSRHGVPVVRHFHYLPHITSRPAGFQDVRYFRLLWSVAIQHAVGRRPLCQLCPIGSGGGAVLSDHAVLARQVS